MIIMEYDRKDIVRISWNDFENYMEKIKNDILEYIKNNNLNIDVIIPILRGGGIPGIYLANQLKVVRILPYQFKYLHHPEKEIKMLDLSFDNLNSFIIDNPTVLVIEGNHSTGNLANNVIKIIKKEKPNSKVLYVALAKDYYYKDSVDLVDFTTCGFYTNENRKLSLVECNNENIEYKKVYISPWELEQEEFSALNNIKFDYRNDL